MDKEYTPNFGSYEPEELNIKPEPMDELEGYSSIQEDIKPKEEESETNKNKKTFPCCHCQEIFFSFRNRLNHVMKFHAAKLCVVCNVCHYVLKNEQELSEHIRLEHPDTIRPFVNKFMVDLNEEKNDSQSSVDYYCWNCSFHSPSEANLIFHKATKHPFINYGCGRCCYSAQTEESMLLHIRSAHKDQSNCNEDAPLSLDASTEDSNSQSCDSETVSKSKSKSSNKNSRLHSCPLCNIEIFNSIFLISHIKTNHRCQYCSFITKDPEDLKSHSSVHSMQSRGVPPILEDKRDNVNSSNSFKKTRNQSFDCSMCLFSSTSRPEMKSHHLKVHKVALNLYSCEFCAFSSKSRRRLLAHLKGLHDFKCDLCLLKFSTQACLDSHSNFFHPSDKNGEQSASRSELRTTEQLTHIDPFDESYKELSFTVRQSQHFGFYYTCHSCQAEFICDIFLHISTFHRSVYKCYSCNLTLPNVNSLTNHVDEVQPVVGIHTCSICGKTFSHKKMLYSHCLVSHRCKFCIFTSTPRTLEYHKKVHTHKQCPLCDVFYCRQKISQHLASHRRKEYKCYICGTIEYFWWGSANKKKTRMHTCCNCKYNMNAIKKLESTKPPVCKNTFLCDVCGFSTVDGKALNDHIGKTHSDFIFYKCQLCDFGAVGKTYLDLHVAEAHKGVSSTKLTSTSLETVKSKFLKNLITPSSSTPSLNTTSQPGIASQLIPSILPDKTTSTQSIVNFPLISLPNVLAPSVQEKGSTPLSPFVLIYNDLDNSSCPPAIQQLFSSTSPVQLKQTIAGNDSTQISSEPNPKSHILTGENIGTHQPSKSSESKTEDQALSDYFQSFSATPEAFNVPLSIKSEPLEEQNEPYPEEVILPSFIPSVEPKIENGMKPDFQMHLTGSEEVIIPD